jgi:uncharacterized protein (TIGR03435 family)
LTAIGVIASGIALIAQDSTLRFEVASVKPNVSADGSITFRPDPADGFFRTNHPLFDGVIRYAYELQAVRVIGAPEWTRTDRFDIAAKASRAISEAERRVMVRALLADRFRMKSHVEMREHTVYLMMEQLGLKLEPQRRQIEVLVIDSIDRPTPD